MSGYTALWIFWVIMFGAIEGPAIANKQPGDTLSEHVWRWFAIKDKSPQWRVRRLALLSGMVWLATHFLSGGWV